MEEMLNWLVFGQTPNILVNGMEYSGFGTYEPTAIAEIPSMRRFLKSVSIFHASLCAASSAEKGGVPKIGADRMGGYSFTRRGLLRLTEFLHRHLSPQLSKTEIDRVYRLSLVRTYLDRGDVREHTQQTDFPQCERVASTCTNSRARMCVSGQGLSTVHSLVAAREACVPREEAEARSRFDLEDVGGACLRARPPAPPAAAAVEEAMAWRPPPSPGEEQRVMDRAYAEYVLPDDELNRLRNGGAKSPRKPNGSPPRKAGSARPGSGSLRSGESPCLRHGSVSWKHAAPKRRDSLAQLDLFGDSIRLAKGQGIASALRNADPYEMASDLARSDVSVGSYESTRSWKETDAMDSTNYGSSPESF